MVILEYGNKQISVDQSKFLSMENQRLLLDGKFIVNTGIDDNKSNKVKKAYYIGVLFELFEKNYYPQFSKREIYAMMMNAYPLFVNERQIENILMEYNSYKEHKDVFA